MEIAEKYLIVYFAGATGMWKGIPVGIAFGSLSSVLILYFAGDNFRNWILKQYGQKRIEKKKNKFMKFANNCGVIGLVLITAGLPGHFMSLILEFIFIKDNCFTLMDQKIFQNNLL